MRYHLEALFADPPVSAAKFENFIEEWLHMCNVADVTSLMRLSGKRLKNKASAILEHHLQSIAHRLTFLSAPCWMFMHMSFIIYGLLSLDENDTGYLDILFAMSKVAVNLTRTGGTEFNPQNLSMLIYGLQNSNCRENESRHLISSLADLIGTCKFNFDAQAIGNTLYGLQGMTSDSLEVVGLISALVPKIRKYNDPLDAQAVGNALYGLQGMSSDNHAIQLLISALLSNMELSRKSPPPAYR